MDENKKLPKPQVKRILGVSKAVNITAVVAGLLILIGIIESSFLLSFTLMEIVILAGVLFVFYIILLMFLLKPRVVKVIIKRKKAIETKPEPVQEIKETSESKKPARKTSKPTKRKR
jgi:hypothetical protein